MFEKTSGPGEGGGLLTAVHKNLNPMVCCDDVNENDFLIIDIKVRNTSI